MLLGAAATCATCQTLAVVAFVFVLSIVTAAAFGLWVRCFLGSSTSFLTALSEFSSLRSYFTWATAQFSVFTCPTSALHIATYLVLQLFSLQQSGEKSEKVTKKLLEKYGEKCRELSLQKLRANRSRRLPHWPCLNYGNWTQSAHFQ